MKNYLFINGKPASRFGVYISNRSHYETPEKNMEEISIPGRNGSIFLDKGNYKNVDVEYEAYCLKAENMDSFRAFLALESNYQRLEDDFDKSTFRMGRFGGIDISSSTPRKTVFTITFQCAPQRWLRSGELPQEIASGSTILNPTAFDALPLIRVYGYGSMTVGGEYVSISRHSLEYIDIDSELMDCYSGSNNCNHLVSMDDYHYPVFAGNKPSKITFTGNISKVVVTPRFWTI